MALTCEYCSSSINEGEKNCSSCGAPITNESAPLNFRACPFCHRRLLALASPACSYCGRRLPEQYIKAREADLKRIAEINEGAETRDVARKVDELISQTARKHGRGSSLDFLDITRLTDLF